MTKSTIMTKKTVHFCLFELLFLLNALLYFSWKTIFLSLHIWYILYLL